jgi:rhodanese-related sulfurtransferase
MRRFLACIAIFLTVALWLASATAYTNISPEEMKSIISDPKQITNVVLVDIRTDKEFADGHAEGAVNVPFVFERVPGDKSTRYPNPEFKNQIKKLAASNPGKKLCLICATAHRSEQAANALAADPALSEIPVVNVFGGIKGRPGVIGLKDLVLLVK